MDYASALNTGLGLASQPKKAFKPLVDSASKVDVKPKLAYIPLVRPAFDISAYVINADLSEALKRFPGSILNISPINGAVEFIFGK